MPSLRFLVRLVPGLLVLWSNVALAGPVERMSDVALHPTNPDIMVVRYLNGGTGLLYTTDGGHNFTLLCASAIDTTRPKADGPIAVGSDGHVFLGTFDTLWEDDSKGCNWGSVPDVKGRWTTDMTVDAGDPARLLAISGNGGEGVKNSIMRRDGSGKWTEIGTQDALGLTSVRSVKTAMGVRIYESALRVDPNMTQPVYLLRYSDDEGKTWTENPLPAQMNAGSVKLEAVDPSNAERLLVSVNREKENDQLLLSRDAGKTFEPYLELSDLGGLTMAPDGRIWIGEPASIYNPMASKGVWFAAKLDAKPTKVAEFGVECLAYQPKNETLFACQAYAFGKLDTKSWEFESYFQFSKAKDFVSCNGKSIAPQCEVQLCADYCAAMHFAQAPLCCAYNTASCGPSVAMQEGTGGPEQCGPGFVSGGSGGTSSAAAGSAAAGNPAAAGSGAAGAGGSVGAAGSKPGSAGSTAGTAAGSGESSDGGGCRTLAARSGGTRAWLLLPLLFGYALVRRRRRARQSTATQ